MRSLRRGADPQRPGGGCREGQSGLLGRAFGQRLARRGRRAGALRRAAQVDQLAAVAIHDDVRMVVLTVGANDTGFGELVAGCVFDWLRSSAEDPVLCRDDAQAAVEAALPALQRGLIRALRDVRMTMAMAGYRRGDYRLVAMGYASPFPAGPWFRYPEDGLEPPQRRWLSGLGRGRELGCRRGNRLDRGGDAGGRECLRGRVPRSAPRPRRSPALRQPRAAGRARGSRRRRAPSGSAVSPPCRARAANRCTRTPMASGRSAPASASSTCAPAAATSVRPRRGGATGTASVSGPGLRTQVCGEGGAAISSTRWPPGAIAWARGAPQCSRRRSTSKPCSCRRSRVGVDVGDDHGDVGARRARSGLSSCIRWIWVPSHSSQVKPPARRVGGRPG